MKSFNSDCAETRQCITVAASFQENQETGYVMLPPWYSSVSGGFAGQPPPGGTMDPAYHLRGHGPVGSFGWKCSMYASPKGFKNNQARKKINAEEEHQCIVRGCLALRCITKTMCSANSDLMAFQMMTSARSTIGLLGFPQNTIGSTPRRVHNGSLWEVCVRSQLLCIRLFLAGGILAKERTVRRNTLFEKRMQIAEATYVKKKGSKFPDADWQCTLAGSEEKKERVGCMARICAVPLGRCGRLCSSLELD